MAEIRGGKSPIWNFSVLAVGEVLSHLATMVINIVLARKLAPALFGEYTLIITYLAIFTTISSLGVRQVIIRSIARHQENSLFFFRISLYLRFWGFLFAVSVYAFYVYVADKNFATSISVILLAGVFSNSLWDALQNVAFGMQRMEWTSIINVTGNLILMSFYLLLPNSLFSVKIVVLFFVSILLLKDFCYYISIKLNKLLTSSGELLPTNYYGILKESFPFYLLSLFTLFSTQLPVVFLEMNSNIEEVAFFNSANKLLLPLTLFMNTAMTAIFPNQAQLYARNKRNFGLLSKKILLFLVVIGCFLALSVSLLRNELVLILFGEIYKNTGDVMSFQCWFLVLNIIFNFIGTTFGAADRQKLLAITSFVYAGISFPILYYSAYYGAIGLSIGYIIAGVINMTYNYYYFIKTLSIYISLKFTVCLFGLILLCMLTAFAIPSNLNIFSRVGLVIVLTLIVGYYFKDIILIRVLKGYKK